MFTSDTLISCATILFIILSTTFVFYHYWFYTYWKKHKIPSLQSTFNSSEEHLGIRFKQVYDEIKANKWKHGGVYIQLYPIYVICDLELLRNITTKDFEYFPTRGFYYNEKGDPLSCHIFNTSGTEWKHVRTNLNQIFTPKKLKTTFPLLLECEKNLLNSVESQECVDVKKLAESFVSDVIESCVFGLEFEESIFQQFGRKILNRSRIRRVKGFIVENFPKLGKILNIGLISKDASDFFTGVVEDAVCYRREKKIFREDFLRVLMNLTNQDGTNWSIGQIAAECFIFFLAGISTSPSAITYALYELARNEKIQNKLKNEIDTVLEKYQNDITYDSIQEIKYLDKVLDETLRKYPPAAYINRRCVKDYKVSGTVIIKRGTSVVIPILGIHHDEDYYPEPEKFDPERFNEENKHQRDSFAFVPFGAGPRICIGMRFGQLQSKLALIFLLRKYKFSVNKKTQEPLKMRKDMLVLTPEGGVWLDVHRIKQ